MKMTMPSKIAWILDHKAEIIDAYADAYGTDCCVGIVWDDPDDIKIVRDPWDCADCDLIYDLHDFAPLYCRSLDNIYDADEWLNYTNDPDEVKTMCIRATDALEWDDYCETLREDDAPNPLEIARENGYESVYCEIISKMTAAEREAIDEVAEDIIDEITNNIIEEAFYND